MTTNDNQEQVQTTNSISLWDWFRSSSPPPILLLDGGVSTHLESVLKKKNQVFSHRSLWSSSLLLTSEGQDDIRECHVQFYNAGANLASTVTYQCHYHVYDEQKQQPSVHDVDEVTMTEMLQTGVRLAREAAAAAASAGRKEQQPLWVIASIGCYGGALADGSEYKGKYGLTEDQLVEFHRRKVQVLREESPDALAFETIPCVMECQAICRLLRELPRQQQATAVWISFACQNGSQLNDGSSLEEALDVLHTMDPDARLVQAVGINCCDSLHVPSLLQKLVQHMAQHGPRRGIVVYPNSGEQWDAKNETWMEGTGCTTPNEFASRIANAIGVVQSSWREHSSDHPLLFVPKMIVGGCCRTSPSTIAAIRQRINDLDAASTSS